MSKMRAINLKKMINRKAKKLVGIDVPLKHVRKLSHKDLMWQREKDKMLT
jgi:hypothetical protein